MPVSYVILCAQNSELIWALFVWIVNDAAGFNHHCFVRIQTRNVLHQKHVFLKMNASIWPFKRTNDITWWYSIRMIGVLWGGPTQISKILCGWLQNPAPVGRWSRDTVIPPCFMCTSRTRCRMSSTGLKHRALFASDRAPLRVEQPLIALIAAWNRDTWNHGSAAAFNTLLGVLPWSCWSGSKILATQYMCAYIYIV